MERRDNQLTTQERFKKYVDYRGLPYRAVEIRCGLPYQYFSRRDKERLPPTYAATITLVFPNLNMAWLFSGEGDMIIKGASDEIGFVYTPRLRLTAFIRHIGYNVRTFELACSLPIGFISRSGLNITNSKLGKIKEAFPMLNTDWVLTGSGTMLTDGTDISREEDSWIRMTNPLSGTEHTRELPKAADVDGEPVFAKNDEQLKNERDFYKAEVDRLTKELADARATIQALTQTIKLVSEK